MKLWISKNSEVPLREQLTRQIISGIVGGELQIGEKLPSVRELALRFKIHQNTVSNAYRKLEESGWVESKKGSGVYVKNLAEDVRENVKSASENELDKLVSIFFRNTQRLGFSSSQIEQSVKNFLVHPKPERILIVESDEYLRQIIFTELQASINFPTFGISPEDLAKTNNCNNSVIIAMPETAEKLKKNLPESVEIISLKTNSPQSSMKGQQKPQNFEMVGIVSGWEVFLRWSKTFLLAVGLESESIITRHAREKNFRKGLNSCVFVITDSMTAKFLSKESDVRIFKLVSDETIEELKTLIH